MILEVNIENFLSINEKVTISLDSSSSKRLPNNIIKSGKDKLLKSVVIYGANASGKSNLIKAMFFIWTMVKNSHSFNVDAKIPRIPFKLDSASKNKPSKFEITFIQNDVKYKYGFSCDNDKIIDECLFYWPKGRISQIFKRTNTKEFEFRDDKKKQELIKTQMNDNVLYLSRSTQLGYNKTKEVYEFIVNNIVINYSPQWQNFTLNKIYDDPKLKQKVIEIMQKADFGGILDIKVGKNKQQVNRANFKIEKDNISLSPIIKEDAEFFDVRFVHESKKGTAVDFNINEESDGTRKTLSMLGPIFDILESGKVAFIDEFELQLHPNISAFLLRLFHSKHNRKNAQLILTTHDTNLLDNELFRRDQIYICSKEPNSYTKLSSFLDYDLREINDFEKAYLTGRVGGLPFIDETFFD